MNESQSSKKQKREQMQITDFFKQKQQQTVMNPPPTNCDISVLTEEDMLELEDDMIGELHLESTADSTANNNSKARSNQSDQMSSTKKYFLKLADVLIDDNLRDLSKDNDIYVLYQHPWIKDQVPRSLSVDDHLYNATNYVKLPFQNNITIECHGVVYNKWQLVQKMLTSKIENVYQLEKAIKTYNPSLNSLQFDILRSYVNFQMNDDGRDFFDELLPGIIQLALDLPNLITTNLPLLDQESSTAIFLSQHQISSLLANAFLCTYTQRYKDDPRSINFAKLYSTNNNEKRKGCKLEKLKCLLNYFRKVIQTTPVGTVSFERRKLHAPPRPEDCNNNLCNFDINSQLCMFQYGADYAVVDFANKHIGGGVLNSGCVQEEILFVICPEMIVGKLFAEKMLEGEALLITGAEQFNTYANYADNFKWKSSHNDLLPRDKYGRKLRQVIAMDALYFHWKTKQTQYEKNNIDRELNKALVAFQAERFLVDQTRAPTIATGNWGCGVYNGDPYLKTLIQIIAASMVKRDVVYFAFNETQLKKDFDQIKCLFENKPHLTVSQLYLATLEFGEIKQKVPKLDLVGFLNQKQL